eukprot:6064299-Pleurochrysis_carterae.AAC.1
MTWYARVVRRGAHARTAILASAALSPLRPSRLCDPLASAALSPLRPVLYLFTLPLPCFRRLLRIGPIRRRTSRRCPPTRSHRRPA